MAISIYKPGQGYWTRTLSAIGAGTIVLAGVAWGWTKMSVISENTIYYQSGMAAAVILVLGGLIYWLLNNPRVADFMIATEAEMKKVNWPSRREIFGSTVVVIAGTLMLAVLLFLIDLLFAGFFQWIGILQG
ncbi:MAG: preprotein translocase subunit SecE [Phycisphaeraceae bacterium]